MPPSNVTYCNTDYKDIQWLWAKAYHPNHNLPGFQKDRASKMRVMKMVRQCHDFVQDKEKVLHKPAALPVKNQFHYQSSELLQCENPQPPPSQQMPGFFQSSDLR